MQDKRLGKYDLELRSPGQEITSEGGEMFITWQPRAALRKLRTDGDMGAAPVTMMRTRPPRDSCRWGGPRSRSATHSVTCCVTMGTGVVPGLCWRWVCPIGCWSWWCPASPQHTSCPRQSSAATSWKTSGLHSGPERQDAIRRKKQEGLRWFLKQDERRERRRRAGHKQPTLSYTRLRSRGTTGKMVGCRVFMSSGSSLMSPWKNPTLAPDMYIAVCKKQTRVIKTMSQLQGLKTCFYDQKRGVTCTTLSNMCAKGRNEMLISSQHGTTDACVMHRDFVTVRSHYWF